MNKTKSVAIVAIFGLVAIITGLTVMMVKGNGGDQLTGSIRVKQGADYARLARVSPDAAKQAALVRYPNATVKNVQLEGEDGYLVYEVLLSGSGKSLELEVDAGTGQILDVENDDNDGDEDGEEDENFTDSLMLETCEFSSTGSNPYFVLEPGFQLVLEGEEDGASVRLVITVLDETELIDGVETRVVEERETRGGELAEVSRNFFAICNRTNSVSYFGEDANIFEGGEIVSTEGSWRAGVDNARAGLFMPGNILLGTRYFLEVAPDVALDRAEIESMTEVVQTPAGEFTNVLKTEETTPLDPDVEEFKLYAPGIGLIKDGALELVSVRRGT